MALMEKNREPGPPQGGRGWHSISTSSARVTPVPGLSRGAGLPRGAASAPSPNGAFIPAGTAESSGKAAKTVRPSQAVAAATGMERVAGIGGEHWLQSGLGPPSDIR